MSNTTGIDADLVARMLAGELTEGEARAMMEEVDDPQEAIAEAEDEARTDPDIL